MLVTTTMTARTTAFAAALALAALASPAAAQESADAATAAQLATEGDPSEGAIQLRPGLQWSMVKGDWEHGFGLSLETIVFPNEGRWNWGFFAEGMGELDGANRTAAGFRAGYGMMGLQLGLAHRTAGDYAASTAIHLAKTLRFGPAGLAFRMAIPVRDYQPAQGAALPTRGVELGVVFQLGWSFTVRGVRPAWGCHGHHGHGEAGAAQ